MKIIFMAAALAAVGATASAGNHCGPRDRVATMLGEKYGESRHVIGLRTNGSILEIWANDETGTWTVTITGPNGMACIVDAGDAFEALAEELEPAGLRL